MYPQVKINSLFGSIYSPNKYFIEIYPNAIEYYMNYVKHR